MTLLELLVALMVLGLTASLAFSSVGPWLQYSRTSVQEAALWRSLGPAQSTMAELATGAIDLREAHFSNSSARFRTLTPRLAPAPLDVALRIEQREGRWRLLLDAKQLELTSTPLLDAQQPIRFAYPRADILAIELRRNSDWITLAAIAFPANAPFVCAYDPIPRTCR
jgi:hypothetical protein